MTATTPPAATAAPDDDRVADRREGVLGRLLVVAGLCGLSVAQPVLDLLGKNPTTFRFNRIESTGIALFAVAVVAVPPLVLWAVGEAARAVHAGLGRIVHAATIGGLGAVFAVLLAKSFTTGTVATALFGAVGGSSRSSRRWAGGSRPK